MEYWDTNHKKSKIIVDLWKYDLGDPKYFQIDNF